MEYELGKFLKTRYVDTKFVSHDYLHTLVSTNGVLALTRQKKVTLLTFWPALIKALTLFLLGF